MDKILYMAPMLAYTDCLFREVYFRHFSGIDRAIAPFIVVSENSKYRKKSVQSLLPALHEKVPVEPQVLAKDPHAFAALTNILEEVGFTSVNINMGCPASGVINKGRGAGMLPYPDQIDQFLDVALSKINIPLSIKLRSGLKDHNEIYALVAVLNRFPLSEVIIHPRLGINKYEGPIDQDVMDDMMAIVRKPIVFSGDVSRRTFYKFSKRFRHIDRWMLGRELLRDPFLPEDIKNGDWENQKPADYKRKPLIKDFHDDLLDSFIKVMFREEAIVGKMKSYWYYWEELLPASKRQLQDMKQILKLDQYRNWVDKILEI